MSNTKYCREGLRVGGWVVVFCDTVTCRWGREGGIFVFCVCCSPFYGLTGLVVPSTTVGVFGDAVLYCVCIEYGSWCTSVEVCCSEGTKRTVIKWMLYV